MGQSLAIPRVIPEDWKRLDLIINKIKMKLGRDSSPTVAGLTITGLTASALIGTNASKTLESVTIGTGLDYTRPTLSLSHLGLEALTDPGADRIFFWDDSASASKWLSVGPSVAITATNLDTIQDIQTSASPTFANLSLGTGELTAGSINRAAGTLTLEIAGTAEISISSTTVTLGGNLVIPDAGYIGSASDANAIQIAASGEVSFTDVVTGILPTAGAHLATKEYVDLAIGASADFFLSDNDDAIIADYHILYDTDTGEASSTLVTDPMVEADDQLMFSYITASGVPGVEYLRAGVYILHTHLSRGTGDKPTTFYWTLSKYTIGDVETVILTSEESSAIPDSTISFITHATLAADTAILVTDRLVLKIYANVGAAGGNSEVTIHMEGTHDCHLTNQLPSNIWQNQGDVLDDLNTLGVVGADGEFLVGTGAGALAWEGGATARASLGLTIGTDVQAYHANLAAIAAGTWTGAASITTLGTIATVGNITIANGGTIGQAAGPLLTFDDTNDYLEITGCNIGVGTITPLCSLGGLDISSGGLSLIIGADNLASTRTNVTNKDGRFGIIHYTNAEQPLGILLAESGVNWGYVFFGGGSGLVNAATELRFYTAADNVTTTGTERATITATNIKLNLPVFIKEQVAAIADTAAYGQIWTKTVTPNTLWFTNDAGGDFQIGGAMASIVMADGGTIGQAAGPLLTFDDTNDYLEITGCKTGFGTATPDTLVHLKGANLELRFEENTAGDLVDFRGSSAGAFVIEQNYDTDATGDIFIRPTITGQTFIKDLILCDQGGRTTIGATATTNIKLVVRGPVLLEEQAAADGDTATYGQIWVKSDAPNILMFTNDAGNDFTVNVTAV